MSKKPPYQGGFFYESTAITAREKLHRSAGFKMFQHIGQTVHQYLVDCFVENPGKLRTHYHVGDGAYAGNKLSQTGHVLAFRKSFISILGINQVGNHQADETIGNHVYLTAYRVDFVK